MNHHLYQRVFIVHNALSLSSSDYHNDKNHGCNLFSPSLLVLQLILRRNESETILMGVHASEKEVLKVVHPRRYVEIHRKPITAGEIMKKYPRHCVARPDVFQNPDIVVRPESVLVPGQVFYLVPYSTLNKLLKAKERELQDSPPVLHPNRLDSVRRDSSRRTSSPGMTPMRELHNNEEYYHTQDSDTGSSYHNEFYNTWNQMRRSISSPSRTGTGTSTGSTSCFNNRVSTGILQPVRSPAQTAPEVRRPISCLKRPHGERTNMNLRVSFASSVFILGN